MLQPGHVVSMEPMLTIPEGTTGLLSAAGGYREHDILVVHETGANSHMWFSAKQIRPQVLGPDLPPDRHTRQEDETA